MKKLTLGALALSLLAAGAAQAQPGDYHGSGQSGYDRDAFWQGAPQGIGERIDFMQQRIDRSTRDGSINPREARQVSGQLYGIRRDADRMRGRMTPQWRANLQARLDNLSQRIHWARHNDDNYGGGRDRQDGRRDGGQDERRDGQGYGYVGAGGPPPAGYGNQDGDRQRDRYATEYDASHDYREGPNYSERAMGTQDQVYRGSDGRYYCKHSDGTTGLVIGGVGGAVVGNVIEGGHNRVAGTLIGGALGALIGKSIDQNNSDVRCR